VVGLGVCEVSGQGRGDMNQGQVDEEGPLDKSRGVVLGMGRVEMKCVFTQL
jgi:hypothetical protein